MIAHLKQQAGLVEDNHTKRKRKKKGGPNPLSCKKKKKLPHSHDQLRGVSDKLESAGKKKKRRRNKKKVDANAA